ncbi:MAG TPA: phosphoglycolate phosphatase, partial [Rhodobiaceae bacterium]|nr:phosphoglycolate phosphatase [Rhodobiaceae bacterium]
MSKTLPPLPTAILFDLDDTLISAYGQPRGAWETVVAEFADALSPLSQTEAVDAISAFALEFWTGTQA